jgi:hypothetical protein
MASEFAQRIYDETLRLYTLKDNGRQRVLLPQGVDEERFAREVQAWSYQLNGGQMERVEEEGGKVFYQFYVSTVSNFQYRWVTDVQPWSVWDQVFEHDSRHESDDKVSLMVYVEQEFGDLFVRHQPLGMIGLPQPPMPTVGVYELWATLLTIPELARNDTIYTDKVNRILNLRRIYDAKSSLDSASISYVMRLLSNTDAMNEWQTYEAEQKVYQDYLAKIKIRNDEVKRLNQQGLEEDKRKEAAIPQLRLKLKYWFFPPTRPRLMTPGDTGDTRRYVGVSLLPANSYFTTRPTNPTPTNLVQYPEGVMYYMPMIMTDSGVTVETTEEDGPLAGLGAGGSGGGGGGGGDIKEEIARRRFEIAEAESKSRIKRMEDEAAHRRRLEDIEQRKKEELVRLEEKKNLELIKLKEKQDQLDKEMADNRQKFLEQQYANSIKLREKEEVNDRALRWKKLELDRQKEANSLSIREQKEELARLKQELQVEKDRARTQYDEAVRQAREDAKEAKERAKEETEKIRLEHNNKKEQLQREFDLKKAELNQKELMLETQKLNYNQEKLDKEFQTKQNDIDARLQMAKDQADAKKAEADAKLAQEKLNQQERLKKMDESMVKMDQSTREKIANTNSIEETKRIDSNNRELSRQREFGHKEFIDNQRFWERENNAQRRHEEAMAAKGVFGGMGGAAVGGGPVHSAYDTQNGLDGIRAEFERWNTELNKLIAARSAPNGSATEAKFEELTDTQSEVLGQSLARLNANRVDIDTAGNRVGSVAQGLLSRKDDASKALQKSAAELQTELISLAARYNDEIIQQTQLRQKVIDYLKVKTDLLPKLNKMTDILKELDEQEKKINKMINEDMSKYLNDPSLPIPSISVAKTVLANKAIEIAAEDERKNYLDQNVDILVPSIPIKWGIYTSNRDQYKKDAEEQQKKLAKEVEAIEEYLKTEIGSKWRTTVNQIATLDRHVNLDQLNAANTTLSTKIDEIKAHINALPDGRLKTKLLDLHKALKPKLDEQVAKTKTKIEAMPAPPPPTGAAGAPSVGAATSSVVRTLDELMADADMDQLLGGLTFTN